MISNSANSRAIWDIVLTATRLHCDESVFRELISASHLAQYDPRDESVVIQIPPGVSRNVYERDAVPSLEKAFANAIGVAPRIFVEESHSTTVTPAPASATSDRLEPVAATSADNDHSLNPAYSFDRFVVGPSNRMAEAAARAVAMRPGQAYNPLFLHGNVGLGKTHLLEAICHEVLIQKPDVKIRFLSCEQFVNDFIDAVKTKRHTAFRKAFRGIDLLAVDDIHFLSKTEQIQEEFFHTFNDLYNAGHQIILSSDSPPREIPALEERLTSRFLWGLAVKLESPCRETREAIIDSKAEQRGVRLPREVSGFIADAVTSNIRELEGAVIQVAAMANMLNRPISLSIAQEALKDLVSINITRRTTIDDIVDITCRHFSVKISDLQGQRRTRNLTLPRQVAMYLCKKLTLKTLNEIGGFFGGRDHTTVLHSIRKIETCVTTKQEVAQRVDAIENELTRHSA